jgi:hypothetical protein
VARRIISGPVGEAFSIGSTVSVRHALFGHDLEKGVILLGRLRGLWIRSEAPEHDTLALLDEFLRDPLPLGP